MIAVILLLTLVSATGCNREGTFEGNSSAGSGARPEANAAKAPQKLILTYPRNTKLVAGVEVEASAEGLPPDRTIDLVWGTVKGGWVVEGHRFRGKRFTQTTWNLAQTRVDANGTASVRFRIPEDYGGVHEVMLSERGVPLAVGGLELSQTFEMVPTEGPAGTPIEIRVKGLGWRTMESTWVVNWDNQNVGWISATDTRGSSVARFRAAGTVGTHHVKLYTGYMGQGYLNHEQAPNSYLPRPEFAFRITPGRVPQPLHAEPYPKQPVPHPTAGINGAKLSITPNQGPVSSRTLLEGTSLPPDATVTVVWETQVGNRVSGDGFALHEYELAKVNVGPDGRVSVPLTVPDDLGGPHQISVRSGDKTLARTYFVTETSVVSMSPKSGPVGTPITIHLKGVGWTDYDNIYVLTYDNGYMGYACGFNSQGDVVVNFKATGAPGVHLIDFYPGIYQGPAEGQQLYRLPQLTYADDHPGNKIPALRFAFEVTAPHTVGVTQNSEAQAVR